MTKLFVSIIFVKTLLIKRKQNHKSAIKNNQLLNIFITICLLSFVIILSNQKIFAQTKNPENKISINVKNKSLENVLKLIEKKTSISFSYSKKKINLEQKISFVVRNKNLYQTLDILFNELNISYIQTDKYIVLTPKPNICKNKASSGDNSKYFTISGYVKDAYDENVLIGAIVSVVGTGKGVATNNYGFFSLKLPEGTYQIRYSYIGFSSIFRNICLNKNINLSEKLTEKNTELNVIVVTEKDQDNTLISGNLQDVVINSSEIAGNKTVAGEDDVLKTVSSTPGVRAFGGGAASFFVRGGDKTNNLILLDEAPVFMPSHLLGFISSIAPESVNKMTFYKTSFPIKTGGVTASITDIQTKKGHSEKIGGGVLLSPFTGTYSIDGPIIKNKLIFSSTLRKSHLNILHKGDYDIGFFDFHTKFTFKTLRKSQYYFSFYRGEDKLLPNPETGLEWKNTAFSFRINKQFSDKIFSNFTTSGSLYNYFLHYSKTYDIFWNSNINNYNLKEDLTYYLSEKHKLNFGISFGFFTFKPGVLSNFGNDYSVIPGNVFETVGYIGEKYKISNKISLNYGIRLINRGNYGYAEVSNFDIPGSVTKEIYEKEKFHSQNAIEARFSMNYAIIPKLFLLISADKNMQFLHMINNSITPLTSMEIWLPAGKNIKAENAYQTTSGLTYKGIEISYGLEAYYKKTENVFDFINHANIMLNPNLENDLRFGNSKSYGAEFYIEKNKGNFKFRASYSYMRAFMKIEGINNSEEYPARYDIPHNFNIVLSYNITKRISINVSSVYMSGFRITTPDEFYDYNGYLIPIYNNRNNSRLPAYYTTDVSAEWRINKNKKARLKQVLSFSVVNVFNRNNIVSVNFNKAENGSGFNVPVNYISEHEYITTGTSFTGIVPAVSYKINFR